MVTPSQDFQRYPTKDLLDLWNNTVTDLSTPVLDSETGESLEYLHIRHLSQHTKYKNIWEGYYYNELERLFQSSGKVKKPP